MAGLSYEGEHTLLPVECKVGLDTCHHVSMSMQVTDSTPVSSVTWIKVGQTSVYSTQPAITVVSIVVTMIIMIIIMMMIMSGD